MFKEMRNSRAWVCVLLIVLVGGAGILAETLNINPHKIVLNAQGQSDDVQANINIVLPGAQIVGFDVTLEFNGVPVAEAESAFYCLLDNILIVGFDRTKLQNNPDVQAMANTTVTASIVDGSVTVLKSDGTEFTREFSGEDTVEIVAPGKKGK